MIRKLNEDYENQTKLNLSEIYSNEEIKLLRKSIPDINNIIYLLPNIVQTNTDNSNSINERSHIQQSQNRFFPSIRKIKQNSNTSYFIDKEKFYTMVLGLIKQKLEKEKNYMLSKSLSLIIDEFLNISKIIKQNLVYYKFFKSIKDAKSDEIKSIRSFSQNKDKIKVKFNTNFEKNNSRNNAHVITYSNEINKTGLILSDKNEVKLKVINKNITNLNKQLSFKMENDSIEKNKKGKFSKSVCEMPSKEGDKIIKRISALKDTSNYNVNSKGGKVNSNVNRTNKNMNKNNLNFTSNNANLQKKNKNINNNFFLAPSKMLLKKRNYYDKRIGLYEYDYSLTNHINQNNKKSLKYKEKLSKHSMEKIEMLSSKKLISPPNIDNKLYQDIDTQEFNIFK